MDPLTLWLLNGERGLSTEAMVRHITGAPLPPGISPCVLWHPRDPDDLRRCRLLVEQVPQIAEGLDHMRTASPTWALIVDHWADLCRVMDEEAPNWRQLGCREKAPRTYRALVQIRLGEVPF
jgi:hypothetical protein